MDVVAALIVEKGHEVRLGTAICHRLVEALDGVILEAGHGTGRVVVNCAGLQSDLVANLSATSRTDMRIMPFRGEYYKLNRGDLVRNLIYPVPDPAFPFLGVHFTRMVGGGVEAGHAVPALAHEGYSWGKVNGRELAEVLRAPSSWVLLPKYWKTEVASSRRPSSRPCSVCCHSDSRTTSSATAAPGTRAQAIAPDGTLLDDFALVETPRMVHVLNAPPRGHGQPGHRPPHRRPRHPHRLTPRGHHRTRRGPEGDKGHPCAGHGGDTRNRGRGGTRGGSTSSNSGVESPSP